MKFLVNGKVSFSRCIDTLLLQIKHENLKKNTEAMYCELFVIYICPSTNLGPVSSKKIEYLQSSASPQRHSVASE